MVRARTAPFVDSVQAELPVAAPATMPEIRAETNTSSATPIPEPVDSSAATVVETLQGWPDLIAAGSEFKHPFPVEKGKLKIQLVDGPSGMEMTSEAVLTWKPTNNDVGSHELKLRVEQSAGPSFERPKIEVVSEELAKSVGGCLGTRC